MSARKPIVVGGILVCLVLGLAILYGLPPTYFGFMSHSQSYYATLATACDHLIETTPHNAANASVWPGFVVIPGNAESLPAAIRRLHANKVVVGTNRVAIVIGSPRLGFGIVWQPTEYSVTSVRWDLATSAESLSRVVYSTNKDFHPEILKSFGNK
jgi:hypothetical protein